MKKNLVFTLLIFFAIQGQSQDYHELLKEGNKWNVLEELLANCYCGSATTYSFTLSNDTLIEDASYKKLMCERISAEKYTGKIINDTFYVAAIRENIVNQTVYVRYPDKEEQLLYAFDLQVGDTLFVQEGEKDDWSEEKLIRFVTNVEQYNINGYTGKKITVSDTSYVTRTERRYGEWRTTTDKYNVFTDDWYEGIGSLKSFVPLGYNDDVFGMELLCFWNHDDLIYHHEYHDKCVIAYTTGIEEISNDRKIEIYPTINKEELIIDSDLDISSVQVYNLTGNKMTETTRKSISIANFPKGIYLVRIQLSDNTVYTGKWIK